VKEETTYGLSPERLARLLALGLQNDDDQDELLATGTPAEALRKMLARELPLDPAMPDSLPAVLNRPCEEMLAAAGQTMSDLLLDPTSDLTVIEALKDYAKKLVRQGGTEAKQAAATAIYYAAIASALVFHQHKITQHLYEKLHQAYTDLDQKPWIPSELKDLFRRADAVCRQRRTKPD